MCPSHSPSLKSHLLLPNSYLTELKFHGGVNLLENAVSVATVIPTPTIERNQDIVYMTATTKLVINGTNFREKNMELVFDPPLERNKDYILSVSETCDGRWGSDLCFCCANYSVASCLIFMLAIKWFDDYMDVCSYVLMSSFSLFSSLSSFPTNRLLPCLLTSIRSSPRPPWCSPACRPPNGRLNRVPSSCGASTPGPGLCGWTPSTGASWWRRCRPTWAPTA